LAGTGAENPPQGYSYVPDVAGGTAFMYHLTVAGHLITNLRIEETIGELASEVTIVIVTHNMQQAAGVSLLRVLPRGRARIPLGTSSRTARRHSFSRARPTPGPPTTCTAASAKARVSHHSKSFS